MPIKTRIEYRRALKEVERVMHATPNSPEGKHLDTLVTLVEAYERKHFRVDRRSGEGSKPRSPH